LQKLMSASNKNAAVTPSPVLGRNHDPSEHADVQCLGSDAHLALVERQMPDYMWCFAEGDYDGRGSVRAVVVALAGRIFREGAPEQGVDA
jgi:hypothetical protein